MRKMLAAFAVALCMLWVLSTVSFAATDNNLTKNDVAYRDELNKLSNEYDLKDIKELPKGIQPIKFDSVNELRDYLKKHSTKPIKIEKTFYAKDFYSLSQNSLLSEFHN